MKLKEQRKTTLNNCGLMILNYPNKTLANNQQMPSEGDISDLLKEFAVAFLRNGIKEVSLSQFCSLPFVNCFNFLISL